MAVEERRESSIRFDLFELDLRSLQLWRSGVAVDLSRQALRILALLAARPNELVTRKQIREALWPGESHGDFDSRMNFAVNKLREALGDSAERPRYIKTVRNAGYRFIAPVRSSSEISSVAADVPSKLPLDQGARSSDPVRGFRFSTRALLAGVIAVVASALAFGGFVRRGVNPGVEAALATRSGSISGDSPPEIWSVSPIFPHPTQKIVVRGRSFGLHVPYAHTDSPYLAIRDETRHWAAGRIIPWNSDEVTVDVESWTDDQIVISGFSGEYGQKGWELAVGDQLHVAVWNPQSGAGPAIFPVVVSSEK